MKLMLWYALSLLCMYVVGFIEARQRISKALFGPWLDSQRTNHGPIYWLRARDYSAAWNAYDATNLPFLRGRFRDNDHTFDSPPEFPVVVTFTPSALAAYERKSHGSTTSARSIS